MQKLSKASLAHARLHVIGCLVHGQLVGCFSHGAVAFGRDCHPAARAVGRGLLHGDMWVYEPIAVARNNSSFALLMGDRSGVLRGERAYTTEGQQHIDRDVVPSLKHHGLDLCRYRVSEQSGASNHEASTRTGVSTLNLINPRVEGFVI